MGLIKMIAGEKSDRSWVLLARFWFEILTLFTVITKVMEIAFKERRLEQI